MSIQDGKTKDDRPCLLVTTPYHPEAVIALRNLMGQWDSCNRWWVLLPEHRGKIEAIINRFWPPDGDKITRIYRFSSEGSPSSPSIDQLEVIRLSSEVIRVTHPDVIEILENNLTNNGSRRYMRLRGSLVVRTRVRPEAAAEWQGGTVSLVDSSDPVDRLLRQVFEVTE